MASKSAQLTTHLQTKYSLPVSPTWLNAFLASTQQHRTVPLSALTQTAHFRLLASDFRDSLTTETSSSLLPEDIFNPTVQERRLQGPIPVQVLDIDDIGTSLWSQVEAIERVERGEAVRGREIVRTVNVDDSEGVTRGSSTTTTNAGAHESGGSNGPHRLILQDARGTRAVAIELKSVGGIALGSMAIGAKLVLRDVTVARGMVLLTPECVTLLGGKVEALDLAWREGRKQRLLDRLGEMERAQG
ncbi:OB fold domain-containing protein [Aspergillus candidus]|uniref:RecQ-mediated genome instability protein 1 n=1 Tax=Aspergillus candidus TaxID=41067 RepID=A0A2I2FCV0_ASPCN|nr:putative RecQ-mediated genome instability protein [Aspergillus candidus]PLB38417.1 putative RecQ-mediated genome instability protein [Aspergillus candidus]